MTNCLLREFAMYSQYFRGHNWSYYSNPRQPLFFRPPESTQTHFIMTQRETYSLSFPHVTNFSQNGFCVANSFVSNEGLADPTSDFPTALAEDSTTTSFKLIAHFIDFEILHLCALSCFITAATFLVESVTLRVSSLDYPNSQNCGYYSRHPKLRSARWIFCGIDSASSSKHRWSSHALSSIAQPWHELPTRGTAHKHG